VLDISPRRDAEAELQSLRAQLAHASRVSMMGQFASALAHELSQPLGAILRNTEAAELFLEHRPPDLDEIRSILVDIRHDEQRAGDVIERLRALLKRRPFETYPLNVSDLLANVSALARVDASNRHSKLEVEASPEIPPVTGDPVQLQQVLLNLVLNALEAVAEMPVGRRNVMVRAKVHGEHEVEVTVRDTGLGIAPDKLGRLFEPFFTTKPNGLGIGLSICRTIIEAHGGQISAESKAGEGAMFRFTLPVAKENVPV
jgi:C4-dicarboxylate-specific signal transduction histidine kinase